MDGIYFLYDGKKLKKDDEDKLIKDLFRDRCNILVLDIKGLMGATLYYIK